MAIDIDSLNIHVLGGCAVHLPPGHGRALHEWGWRHVLLGE